LVTVKVPGCFALVFTDPRSGLPEVTHRDIVEAEREISEKEKAPSGILYLAAGYYLKGWIYSYDQDGVVANLSDGEVKALFRLAYEKGRLDHSFSVKWGKFDIILAYEKVGIQLEAGLQNVNTVH
ncbi:hypothetical protein Tco_1128074, partial [Tanacetum coccineum]